MNENFKNSKPWGRVIEDLHGEEIKALQKTKEK